MLYAHAPKILPTYYRDSYRGEYRLLHMGSSSLQNSPITALHYHRCMEMGICLSGSGITHIGDRIYNFREGDMQCVAAGVPHLSASDPNVESRWIWMSFEPLRLLRDSGYAQMELMHSISTEGFCGVFHPWEHPILAQLLERLRLLAEERPSYWQQQCAFLAGEILVECARIGSSHRQQTEGYPGRLQPAIRHIRENYGDKDAMQEGSIAGICGMSVSHFRAVFKQETGLTVREFIIQTRLAAAAHLLQRTDSSIMDIALQSGFGQISCFNRQFLKRFGQSPSAFRKQNKR